jgi:hypothetical protein
VLAKIAPVSMGTGTHSPEFIIVEPKIYIVITGSTYPAACFVISYSFNLHPTGAVIVYASIKDLVSSVVTDFFLIQQFK